MPLLRRNTTEKNGYKLVGASLPSRIHSYLTLYCIAKNSSRTAILRELLEMWISRERKTYTDEELIHSVTQKINLAWRAEKTSGRITQFKAFSDAMRTELLSKGVDEKTVQKIFMEVHS